MKEYFKREIAPELPFYLFTSVASIIGVASYLRGDIPLTVSMGCVSLAELYLAYGHRKMRKI